MIAAGRPRWLCLVTDRRRLPGVSSEAARLEALLAIIEAAARAGVDLVQIRERDLPARALVAFVRRAVEATRATRARVVVNDRLDVALAAEAAGVHLRGDSPPADRVRAVVPPGFLVGRSVHSEAEAVAVASRGGVDYLIAGTVFPTASKAPGHPTLGLDGLGRIVQRVGVPVLGIGGITLATVASVARAGAGVAAVGLFSPPAGEAGADIARIVEAARAGLEADGECG